MVLVVGGPAGAGKSTVGRALAARLGWRFVDGDDLHPPANVAKMRGGFPLDDNDRAPWPQAIRARIDDARARGEPLVVACSALREAHRRTLGVDGDAVRFVVLDAPPDVLRARLAGRAGHFFPPSLLGSQLAALERPEEGVVDVTQPLDDVIAAIARLVRDPY
jgi:gluconokinase